MPKRIFIAGHNGMVGRALHRTLEEREGFEIVTRGRDELNLEDQSAVNDFFAEQKIDEVYLAAARVGGIYANHTYPAEFIYQNLMIQTNVIHAAHQNDVQKLLFLGSSCIYPRLAKQPIKEEYLLGGQLEPTNEPYAVAKIAGIKMCESYNRQYGRSYRSIMPTNLYGPHDLYDDQNSHVVPALISRIHHAKVNDEDQVVIWGSGKCYREFLHVYDMADAAVFVMEMSDESLDSCTEPMRTHVNIGTGKEYSIECLAKLITKVVGYNGTLVFDINKPDGTPRKLLDVCLLERAGWKYSIELENGLESTYHWYQQAIA